jgi:pyridoxine 5-phosphate synthase
MIRLNVNIDHIATVREARRAFEPSLATAAALADLAGAHGITVHLRADRRHIQDDDVRMLRSVVKTHLNLEMAATEEMLQFACAIKPNTVTLVPERANEITTEGGLDLLSREGEFSRGVERMKAAGILVSIFLDPIQAQIDAAAKVGAGQIEICTSRYSDLTNPTLTSSLTPDAKLIEGEIERIEGCVRQVAGRGLQVAAGHGLTYRNVGRIAAIESMEELNIGHNIVSRAVFVGLERAVREMLTAMQAAV